MASNQTTEAIYYHGSQLQIDHTPSGADVAAGEIVALDGATPNAFVGVANSAIPDGRKGSVDIQGIYKVAKDNTDTFAQGVKVSWDDTAKQAEPDGGANEDAIIGICVKAAVAADDFVLVAINRQPNVT